MQAEETCNASKGFKPHSAENLLAKVTIRLLLATFTEARVLSKPLHPFSLKDPLFAQFQILNNQNLR